MKIGPFSRLRYPENTGTDVAFQVTADFETGEEDDIQDLVDLMPGRRLFDEGILLKPPKDRCQDGVYVRHKAIKEE